MRLACAVPLRNIADVKPEIAHVIATEEITAAKYQTAADAFKKGRTQAEALARVAERTIVPELQAADARLVALKNVPPEHQPLVSEAESTCGSRGESWRVRAEAVRRMNAELRRGPEQGGDPTWRLQAEARYRSNLAVMGKAEGAERNRPRGVSQTQTHHARLVSAAHLLQSHYKTAEQIRLSSCANFHV